MSNGKLGRPTKYNDALQAKADSYIDSDLYAKQEAVPTLAGLAVFLGVCRDTVMVWAKDNEIFSYTVKKLMAKQQLKLQNGGLTKEYDAGMSKFMLAANHGMSDKTQVDLTSSDGSMTPQDNSQAVLDAIRAKHAKPE